ncbi:GTP cyclohydrolase FolE2 [Luteimonas sp. S4-F44]|uniref:GTP cyclohydrolase FolE2 n=1 Tax=Luteimonas sp. S4-F44 TaxID=2925842 RepID=UPI001F52F1BC|nr:GTP cyclohydrolase FolE2 [Luteimonas sp. S4-F44]UNK41086.1 GTP cyclohydrolase FolE2 [Luteimonas sp. S4-F44]
MSDPVRPPVLPDVAGDQAQAARLLDWVGMAEIALPLRIEDGDGQAVTVPARADIGVNLIDPDARGIHMSRLYLHLQDALARETLGRDTLARVLADCIDSQRGLADRVQLTLKYGQLLRRRALASDHSGWKTYPIELDAVLGPDGLALTLTLSVEYSSTCPASAALSRQLNAARFAVDFAGSAPSFDAVHDWLASPRGLAATPHAQRSRATVRLRLSPDVDALPVLSLIDALELALGTPVQTAVKREDEQAFAALNAEHLMFCEDAARRVAAVLTADPRVARFEATVAHFESLHAHDAVARVSG